MKFKDRFTRRLFKVISIILATNISLIILLGFNANISLSQIVPKIDINDIEREVDNCLSGGCDPRKIDPNKVLGDTFGLGVCHSAHDYVTAFNSGQGEPLTESQKKYLSPFFGNIVDQVRIYWVANLPPSEVDHQKAQTFGNKIYIANAKARKELDTRQILLFGHEIVHTQQYKRHGGLTGFCKKYSQEWLTTGFNYDRMPLENEARNIEFQFAQYLGDKYLDRPPTQRYYEITHSGVNNSRTTLVPAELPIILSDEYQCGIAGCQNP